MQTALQKLKQLWAAGEYRKALKLAASWPNLGKDVEAIRQGWAAVSNPSFYEQLGKEPRGLYFSGLLALVNRYHLQEAVVVDSRLEYFTITEALRKEFG